MTIRFDRPVSKAAHASRFVAAFALVLSILVLLGHRFGPLATPYMVLFLLVAAGLACLAVLLAVTGLVQLWRTGAEGGIPAFKALIYAALPIALVGFAAERYVALPSIYDVSTDPADVPQWLRLPHADQIWLKHDQDIGPAERDAQSAAYPELIGRRYEGAMDRVLEAARKVAADSRIVIATVSGAEGAAPEIQGKAVRPAAGAEQGSALPQIVPVPTPRPYDEIAALIHRSTDVTLQGEKRTAILGLRFDVLIRLREEAETTLVDVRVASRYGPHDLGISASIAQAYLRALDAELLGIAGN